MVIFWWKDLFWQVSFMICYLWYCSLGLLLCLWYKFFSEWVIGVVMYWVVCIVVSIDCNKKAAQHRPVPPCQTGWRWHACASPFPIWPDDQPRRRPSPFNQTEHVWDALGQSDGQPHTRITLGTRPCGSSSRLGRMVNLTDVLVIRTVGMIPRSTILKTSNTWNAPHQIQTHRTNKVIWIVLNPNHVRIDHTEFQPHAHDRTDHEDEDKPVHFTVLNRACELGLFVRPNESIVCLLNCHMWVVCQSLT